MCVCGTGKRERETEREGDDERWWLYLPVQVNGGRKSKAILIDTEERALLLKHSHGAKVTVLCVESGGIHPGLEGWSLTSCSPAWLPIGCWGKEHHPLQSERNKQPQQLNQVPSFVMQQCVCACACLFMPACECVSGGCLSQSVCVCLCVCVYICVHVCVCVCVYVGRLSSYLAVVCTLINDFGAQRINK